MKREGSRINQEVWKLTRDLSDLIIRRINYETNSLVTGHSVAVKQIVISEFKRQKSSFLVLTFFKLLNDAILVR